MFSVVLLMSVRYVRILFINLMLLVFYQNINHYIQLHFCFTVFVLCQACWIFLSLWKHTSKVIAALHNKNSKYNMKPLSSHGSLGIKKVLLSLNLIRKLQQTKAMDLMIVMDEGCGDDDDDE